MLELRSSENSLAHEKLLKPHWATAARSTKAAHEKSLRAVIGFRALCLPDQTDQNPSSQAPAVREGLFGKCFGSRVRLVYVFHNFSPVDFRNCIAADTDERLPLSRQTSPRIRLSDCRQDTAALHYVRQRHSDSESWESTTMTNGSKSATAAVRFHVV